MPAAIRFPPWRRIVRARRAPGAAAAHLLRRAFGPAPPAVARAFDAPGEEPFDRAAQPDLRPAHPAPRPSRPGNAVAADVVAVDVVAVDPARAVARHPVEPIAS